MILLFSKKGVGSFRIFKNRNFKHKLFCEDFWCNSFCTFTRLVLNINVL